MTTKQTVQNVQITRDNLLNKLIKQDKTTVTDEDKVYLRAGFDAGEAALTRIRNLIKIAPLDEGFNLNPQFLNAIQIASSKGKAVVNFENDLLRPLPKRERLWFLDGFDKAVRSYQKIDDL